MKDLFCFIAKTLLIVSVLSFASACNDASDLLDLALDPPERKPIDQTKLGVNNFFVDREFGSIPAQFSDIKNTLGIEHVRILMAWTSGVQETPDSPINFSFYDEIINAVPADVDILVVLAHAPDWMSNPANWYSNNPRYTWVVRWLRPVVERYATESSIIGFEVWNEPDVIVLPGDAALGLEQPENYIDLLNYSAQSIRDIAPNKKVVIAATQSIQQNFPTNLKYNKKLKELGAENLIDIWNIHYYGTSYESVITSSGVADFLNGLSIPIWLTESGETGVNDQLAYVERTWPFLIDKVPSIERTYYYEYANTAPVDNNFGLRTTDPAFPVSDLYLYLKNN